MLQWSYYTYWSGPAGRRLRDLHPPRPRLGRGADQRRADDARRRLAVRRVDGLQGRRRGQLPQDPRARARVRRTRPRARRGSSGSPAASVPELLPQARTAPGGRSSATPATTRTRSPPRASATRSATPKRCSRRARRRRSRGARSVRRRDGGLPAARDAHALPIYEFTTQLATLEAAAARDAAAARRRPRQPGRHGRVRQRHRRDRVAGGVLRPRQHRAPHVSGRRRMNDLFRLAAGVALPGRPSVSPTRPGWPWVHGRR